MGTFSHNKGRRKKENGAPNYFFVSSIGTTFSGVT